MNEEFLKSHSKALESAMKWLNLNYDIYDKYKSYSSPNYRRRGLYFKAKGLIYHDHALNNDYKWFG